MGGFWPGSWLSVTLLCYVSLVSSLLKYASSLFLTNKSFSNCVFDILIAVFPISIATPDASAAKPNLGSFAITLAKKPNGHPSIKSQ